MKSTGMPRLTAHNMVTVMSILVWRQIAQLSLTLELFAALKCIQSRIKTGKPLAIFCNVVTLLQECLALVKNVAILHLTMFQFLWRAGVNFTNVLRSAFAPTVLRQ